MDIVSSSVKKAILQGKDINLSMLLITGFEINKADKEKGMDKHPIQLGLSYSIGVRLCRVCLLKK